MISGTFTIEVRCLAQSRDLADRFKVRVSKYIFNLDPDYSIEFRQFSGLFYIFTWAGIPLDLGSAQNLFKFLNTQTVKYLSSYKLTIKIHLFEKGI